MGPRGGTALLLAGILGACADSEGDPDGGAADSSSPSSATTTVDVAALDGRSFASTSVEGAELAEGTTIEVGFEDENMSVWAGCNTAFGPFEVEGTTIAWTSDPASTMMMCDPDLLEQDRWLTDLFRSGVDATAEGDALTLQADGVTIELETDAPDDLTSLLGAHLDRHRHRGPTAQCPGYRSTPAVRGSTSERTVCPASSPGAGAVASPCRSRRRHWSSPT